MVCVILVVVFCLVCRLGLLCLVIVVLGLVLVVWFELWCWLVC